MFQCPWCPKEFPTVLDIIHHVDLDHDVSQKRKFDDAAREGRKNFKLSQNADDPLDVQCPWCFVVMTDIGEAMVHFKKVHNRELLPEIVKELFKRNQALSKENENVGSKCTNCLQTFYGVIATQIAGRVEYLCFNCYENYWGHEALGRILMGTPADEVARMREPIKNI